MLEYREKIEQLLELWINDQASDQDKQELSRLLEAIPPSDNGLMVHLNQLWEKNTDSKAFSIEQRDALTARILRQFPAETDYHSSEKPAHRGHFLRRGFFRYAAAVLILIGAATWYVVSRSTKADHQTLATGSKHLQTDIVPGGEKAVLTLADGTKIILDSAANGKLANQGGAQVVKLASGQIAYNLQGLAGEEVVLNTMSTPGGGQYQVTLPDGTKVWLNAASSITFPTAFISNKRRVKIQGEAYFEVAKNKQKPFIVDVDGKSLVEVLGTSFNINSYENEKSIKTTLLEGSVKVQSGNVSELLKPGQQAVIAIAGKADKNASLSSDKQQSVNEINVLSNVNLDQALAWKNGLFNIQDANFPEVARQLERWYDIQVKYEGTIPTIKFKGKMDRGANLSDILKILNKLDIRCRMEGRTLVVAE